MFDLKNTPIDPDEDDPFDEYLSSVAYVIQSSYHRTHGNSPSQLVFGRDMFVDSKAEINWDKSNEREKSGRMNYTYKKGNMILIQRPRIIRKLSIPFKGPYRVVRYNKNGTITYENL